MAANRRAARSRLRIRGTQAVRRRDLRPALLNSQRHRSERRGCVGALLAYLGTQLGRAAMAGSEEVLAPLLRIRAPDEFGGSSPALRAGPGEALDAARAIHRGLRTRTVVVAHALV